MELKKLDYLQNQHAKIRQKAGGHTYDEMLNQVINSAKQKFSESELRAVGIGNGDELRGRIAKLLRETINFPLVNRWLEQRAYFFSDDAPSSVEIKSNTATAPLSNESNTNVKEETIRKILLDLMQQQADAGQPFDENSINELLSTAQDRVVIEAGLGATEAENNKFKKPAMALIAMYLRAWIAWGKSGPTMAATMDTLGFDVCLRRIEKGKTVQKSGTR